VHEKTRPALQMLEKEGLYLPWIRGYFDAGPTVEANLKAHSHCHKRVANYH